VKSVKKQSYALNNVNLFAPDINLSKKKWGIFSRI